MAITIPELPPADFNKELRLVLSSNNSYLAQTIREFVSLEELAKLQHPVIIFADWASGRSKKADLETFINYIQSKVKDPYGETLGEALQLLYQISLADRLPDNLQHELESFLWRHYDRDNV